MYSKTSQYNGLCFCLYLLSICKNSMGILKNTRSQSQIDAKVKDDFYSKNFL